MRRSTSACLIFAALYVFLFSTIAVSKAATYYVSPTGSDTAAGTSAHPFQTISKAAEILVPGDKCVLCSGDYRETVSPKNSGTDLHPIQFISKKNALVTVSGTDPVTDWTLYKGEIYVAHVSGLEGDALVFQNQGTLVKPLIEARWPAISSWNLSNIHSGMAKMTGGSNDSVTDTSLTQADGYWNGATVWVRGGFAWLPQTSTVRSFDSATHTLTVDKFQSGPGLDPVAGNDYYLTNCLGALSGAGQYYYDRRAGLLYVWADSGGVPQNIEVKVRTNAFDLNSRSDIFVDGVSILAGTISMNKSDGCKINHVKASYLAYSDTTVGYGPPNQMRTGIAIVGDNNEIRNSDIGWSTGCLVSIDGNDNRIINSIIHDGDLIGTYAPLVYLSSGKRNLVSNNTLTDCGRYGIFIGSGNSDIEHNDISNFMWLSEDGGGIYCWGVDLENSWIHHNLVHDSRDYKAGNGIYLDNYDENAVVDHNVIYDVDHNGITLNTPAYAELVFNNTVTKCANSVGYWGQAPYDQDLYSDRVYNNVFQNKVSLPASCLSENNVVGTAAMLPNCGAFDEKGKPWTAGWDPHADPHPVYAVSPAPYQNLIANSGFETGLDSWTPTGTQSAAVIGVPSDEPWQNRGKNRCLQLGNGLNGITQSVTALAPNTTYRLSVWAYAAGSSAYSLTIETAGGVNPVANGSSNTYQHLDLLFTTRPADKSAVVSFSKTKDGAAPVIADDFCLTKM